MNRLEFELMPGIKKKYLVTIHEGYEMPVWMICGKEPGKTLVMTAGVHGCEYVGIQAAKHLFNSIEAALLRGNIIILPLMNQKGFYYGSKQVMPEDEKNLNRVFPGDKSGSLSQQIAYWMESEIYPKVDFIIDLHGGDINEVMTPLVFFPVATKEVIKQCAQEAARHMPVAYRIPSTSKNGLYSYGVQKGIPGLLLEIGGRGKWSEEDVRLCIECVNGVMGYLEMGVISQINKEQKESVKTIYEESNHNGFWYPYVEAGEAVSYGQVLGELKDIHDQVIAVYRAQVEGVILYYTDTLGVQKGDSLVAYGQME